MIKTSQKGITLVALTITIIVLLILAGVSISVIVGDNGILNRASNSADVYKKSAAKEKLDLQIANLKINETGKATLDDLKKSAETNLDMVVTLDNEINPTKAIVQVDDYTFTIDKNLELVQDENVADLPESVLKGMDSKSKIQMKLTMPVTQ